MKLELSQAEVEAVISYIYQHCRTSAPNGKGYKVWEKMWAFQNAVEDDDQLPLFEAVDVDLED